jgi:hypothetical protein
VEPRSTLGLAGPKRFLRQGSRVLNGNHLCTVDFFGTK